MAKSSRSPRRRVPTVTPLQHAILTNGPLPADVGPFEADAIMHPDQPGLLAVPGHTVPFAVIWRQHHGRAMTAADVIAVAARGPEIEAAVERTHTRNRFAAMPAPGSDSPSNWPSTEGPIDD